MFLTFLAFGISNSVTSCHIIGPVITATLCYRKIVEFLSHMFPSIGFSAVPVVFTTIYGHQVPSISHNFGLAPSSIALQNPKNFSDLLRVVPYHRTEGSPPSYRLCAPINQAVGMFLYNILRPATSQPPSPYRKDLPGTVIQGSWTVGFDIITQTGTGNR